MSNLFKPIQIKNIRLKNRIVVSPMCQYSSRDGFAGDWHLVHLGTRAVGGAGLIIAEATAVSPEGRISPDDLGIWTDEHVEKLLQITAFITAQDCVPGIQLAHAGRKGSTVAPWKGEGKVTVEEGGWIPVAPSAIAYSETYPEPAELTKEGINKVIADFTLAAERSLRAGFKVIELHCAHGYLLHQFISPLSNRRTDNYGGRFENRIRLLMEVIAAVQTVWPDDLPLFVRISATDWAKDGWDLEESICLTKLLKDKGVDLIDVSTGGLVEYQQIPVGFGYQLPFASQIKRQTGMLTGTVGLITSAIQAETILTSGDADMVLLGRELLRDPYFPLKAARELRETIVWPVQYERAR